MGLETQMQLGVWSKGDNCYEGEVTDLKELGPVWGSVTHFSRWWAHLAVIDGPFHLLWSSIGPCAHTHRVVIMVKGKRSCNRHG